MNENNATLVSNLEKLFNNNEKENLGKLGKMLFKKILESTSYERKQ